MFRQLAVVLFLNSTVASAMECAELATKASSYDSAVLSCTACNTTAGNLTFEEAASTCPNVGKTWCMQNDPSCSLAGSGCSGVISCKKDPDPPPPPDPRPTPSPDPVANDEVYRGRRPRVFPNPQSATQAPQKNDPSTTTEDQAARDKFSKVPLTPEQLCATYPEAPQCRKPPTQLNGQAGFGEAAANGREKFNLPDARVSGVAGSVERGSAVPGLETKVHVVPNNSGGGFAASPSVNQKLDGKKPPTTKGSKVELGLNAPGGGGAGADSGWSRGDRESRSGQRRGAYQVQRAPAEAEDFNLNSFLPGGQLDPRRKAVRGQVYRREIHDSSVDLFSRISIRMQEYCVSGHLIDCR